LLVDTYEPMGFSLNRGGDGLFTVNVKDTRRLAYRVFVGRDIVEAHRALVAAVGRPETVPSRDDFTYPIFNTWIEHLTRVDQAKVLAYARKICDNGFAARLLEIDDGWAVRYGDQRFDPRKFPDPGSMVKEIQISAFGSPSGRRRSWPRTRRAIPWP
jgi:alpha-glucosidase (family GH31 glycosyl hydrolase)